MFQESEIISLLLAVIAVFIVVFIFMKKGIAGFQWMYAGFFAIVASMFFTVLEGVFLGGVFNLLEHVCIVLAGVAFFIGCWSLGRISFDPREKPR